MLGDVTGGKAVVPRSIRFRCDVVHLDCLLYMYIYRVSQEERTKLREGVPYVELYRYNPKHLCPKLNGFRDNGK